jgi:CRP-like cAMP-binding protein
MKRARTWGWARTRRYDDPSNDLEVLSSHHRIASSLRADMIFGKDNLIDQLFNSSEKRLARLLLLLANFGKEGKPEPIVGKISQETLAEMIGTTRSRVSFFMNKFRKLGLIEYNGKLEVHNSLLNLVLHDKPEIKTRDEAISAD